MACEAQRGMAGQHERRRRRAVPEVVGGRREGEDSRGDVRKTNHEIVSSKAVYGEIR